MAIRPEEQPVFDLGPEQEPAAHLQAVSEQPEQSFAITPAPLFEDDHVVGYVEVQSNRIAQELNGLPKSSPEAHAATRASLIGRLLVDAHMHPGPPESPDIQKAIAKAEATAGEEDFIRIKHIINNHETHVIMMAIDKAFDSLASDTSFNNGRQLHRTAALIIDAADKK